MAESKSLDSARLALSHALLLIFGKASHKFFEVADSVIVIFGKASHKFFEVADSVIVLDSVNTFKSKLVLVCKLCIL